MQLTHPALLGLIVPAALLIGILERRVPGTRLRKTSRWFLRSAIVALGLVALAGPYAPQSVPTTQRLVVALDVSRDMDERARKEAEVAARDAMEAARQADAAVSWLAYARNAQPARATDRGPFYLPWSAGPSPERGRLLAGLAAAELAFREHETGSILLLTSGRGDLRGVAPALERLGRRGIEVHGLALPQEAQAERPLPRIVAVQSPEVVRGPFTLRAAVDGRGEDVRVRLLVDGRRKDQRLVGAGTAGEVRFDVTDLAPGEHELGIVLERTGVGEGDGDTTSARVGYVRRLVMVGKPPRVLALLTDPDRSDLRRALATQGMQVQAIPPTATARALTEGASFDVAVLDAASAVQLDTDAQQLLRQRVREGLGIVFEAGEDQRAWEALRDMPLADLLPLRPVVVPEPKPEAPTPEPPPPAPTPPIDPPEEDEGPGIEAQRQPSKALPITVLLLIDRSASMAGSKLATAIEGARRAASTLSKWDRLGVITFADEATLDFAPRSAHEVLSRPLWLSNVSAGGGTDIFRALRLASQVMAKETTPIQHVILLSDGKTGGIRLWPHVVGPMGQRGVTMTAVGIGESHSRKELRSIIQWAARASLVSVRKPDELITVMTKDTRGLATRRDAEAERLDRLNNPDREPEQPKTPDPEPPQPPQPEDPKPEPPTPPAEPEKTAPELLPLERVRAHEALRGFEGDALPDVGPPRAAEPGFGAVVLLAREDRPVLAARRFGLGRVLEWVLPPDDAGSRGWRELGRLFGQGARAVMTPEGAFRYLPRIVVTATPDGDRVHVEWPKGDATRVTLAWTSEDGAREEALGTFDPADPEPHRTLPRTERGGLCRITATLEDGRTMLPVSYLSTPPPTVSASPAGDADALARVLGAPPPDAAAVGRDLPAGERERRRPLTSLFLWIAVALLPFDVLAHRRSVAR